MSAEGRSRAAAGAGAALGASLVLVVVAAVNLRPAITAVGAVAGDIEAATGLSTGAAGLLVALPLVAFAVVAPFAPWVEARLGATRAMAAVLAVLTAGIVIRSLPGAVWLFAGTIVLGVAIAVGNVLMPTLVKRDFPDQAGPMTGLYTTAVSLVSSLAPGLTALLAVSAGLGWRAALAAWALPAGAAAAAWLPRARRRREAAPAGGGRRSPLPLRSGLAWCVTVYMGISALTFYVSVAWLPEVLVSRGFGQVAAGWTVSVSQLAGLVVTFLAPVLAGRLPDQRLLAAGAALVTLSGLAGLLVGSAGGGAALAAVALGLGQSATFSLALTFMVLRAADAPGAAALAGMAQAGGYLLAAGGPVAFGAIHDASGGWTLPLGLLALTCLVMAAAGLGAGAPAHVRSP